VLVDVPEPYQLCTCGSAQAGCKSARDCGLDIDQRDATIRVCDVLPLAQIGPQLPILECALK
jgi:hypothetical protein